MIKTILLLEDDYTISKAFEKFASINDFIVFHFYTPSDMIDSKLDFSLIDLIVSDFDMMGETALDLLKYLKDNNINTPVILNTGNSCCINIIKNKRLDSNIVYYADKTECFKDIFEKINNLI